MYLHAMPSVWEILGLQAIPGPDQDEKQKIWSIYSFSSGDTIHFRSISHYSLEAMEKAHFSASDAANQLPAVLHFNLT